MSKMRSARAGAALAAIVLAGCARGADARQAREAVALDADAVLPAGAVRFDVAPDGNAARYRVREQLMGHDLPNDAVGETRQVTGRITLDGAGKVIADQSRIVVGVASLRSDRDRRDGYVRMRLLETDQYPHVELAPTAVRGLPDGFPTATGAAGPVTFDLLGNLTVRGVVRATTWHVIARRDGGQVTGKASTWFTFEQFGLEPPRVPVVLSVADTIVLEYDFTLKRSADAATPSGPSSDRDFMRQALALRGTAPGSALTLSTLALFGPAS